MNNYQEDYKLANLLEKTAQLRRTRPPLKKQSTYRPLPLPNQDPYSRKKFDFDNNSNIVKSQLKSFYTTLLPRPYKKPVDPEMRRARWQVETHPEIPVYKQQKKMNINYPRYVVNTNKISVDYKNTGLTLPKPFVDYIK